MWADGTNHERLKKLGGQQELYGRLAEVVARAPECFQLKQDRVGLTLSPAPEVGPSLSRCCLKLFHIRAQRFCVFFYKSSLLPFSKDRFSYGGRLVRAEQVQETELKSWLDFLASGLLPSHRPDGWVKAVRIDVPH